MKELTFLRNAPTANPTLTVRTGNPDDAQICGEICFQAFETIAEQYDFPSDFPTLEVAQELMARLFDRSNI